MRWLGKAIFRFIQEQRGFTLIGTLIAVGIMAFIGTGLLRALDTNSRATRLLDEKVVAVNLATNHLEVIKESPYAETYPSAGDNITIPFQYSVTIDTYFSNDGSIWSDNYNGETLQKVIVSVSREGKPVFSIATYRAKR